MLSLHIYIGTLYRQVGCHLIKCLSLPDLDVGSLVPKQYMFQRNAGYSPKLVFLLDWGIVLFWEDLVCLVCRKRRTISKTGGRGLRTIYRRVYLNTIHLCLPRAQLISCTAILPNKKIRPGQYESTCCTFRLCWGRCSSVQLLCCVLRVLILAVRAT